MNNTTTRFSLPIAKAECFLSRYLAAVGGQSPNYQCIQRTTIRRFLADHGRRDSSGTMVLRIKEAGLLSWMIRYVAGKDVKTVWQRLAFLNAYLTALVQAGLTPTNPIADFKTSHGNLSWERLIPALQSANPDTALSALRSRPVLPGPLHIHIRAYLELQRSLGRKFETQQYILAHFDRFLGGRKVSSLSAISDSLLRDWMDTLTCSSNTRICYAQMLSRFFQHLLHQKVVAGNPVAPLASEGRTPGRAFRPFIFTQEQITAVLTKARQLPKTVYSPYKGLTCYTAFALLYALGLRHGEVRRLRVRDLDLNRQALFIDQTKFYKSRYVPFGPRVKLCLEQFLEVRRTFLRPLQLDDPLFVTLWRRPFDHHLLQDTFSRILGELGIKGLPSQRRPRLHDLRHTFAVHRLLRWYREGVDVQNRLPILSTFLGHIGPGSTQVYLSITAELLQEANGRFHRHFGRLLEEVGHE